MSYSVKPEDIPEEMHEICDGMLGPKHIASVINTAIDLGLVSPPCYVIAYPNGNLVMHEPGEPVSVYPGKGDGPHCHHYKGQTE